MLVYSVPGDDKERIIDAANSAGMSATRFIERAIHEALSQHERGNGPFRYLIINANQPTASSKPITNYDDCKYIALRHGALLINTPSCEVVVVDRNSESIFNAKFTHGQRIVEGGRRPNG